MAASAASATASAAFCSTPSWPNTGHDAASTIATRTPKNRLSSVPRHDLIESMSDLFPQSPVGEVSLLRLPFRSEDGDKNCGRNHSNDPPENSSIHSQFPWSY